MAAFAAIAVIGFLVAGRILDDDGGDVPDDTASEAVRLVSATSVEDASFTESVADARSSDVDALVTWSETGGGIPGPSIDEREVRADSAVVYGTRAEAPCDAEAMVERLTADSSVAAAWADLMGIAVADIEVTVASLTPVLLAHDTYVINSEYRDGRARRFPAILQAGTPVMVDWSGVPRVKCSCSNPLGTPDSVDVSTTTGEAWAGFEASSVVAIGALRDGGGRLDLRVYDVDAGEETDLSLPAAPRTPGEGTEMSGFLVRDTEGVHLLAEDGGLVTIIDRPVANAWDDGMGGIIYQELRTIAPDCAYCSQGDVVWTEPASSEEAAIWHLPAGEEEPVILLDTPNHEESWLAVGDVGILDGRSVMVYNVVEPDPDDPAAEYADTYKASLVLRDLEDGTETEIHPAYSTWEMYPGPYRIGDGLVLTDISYAERDFTAFGPDGKNVDSGCELSEEDWYDMVDSDCPQGSIPLDDGEVAGVATDSSGRPTALQVWNRTTGSAVREFPLDPRAGDYWNHLDAYDGVIVFSSPPFVRGDTPVTPFDAFVVDLDTGEQTELSVGGAVRLLRAPLVRP